MYVAGDTTLSQSEYCFNPGKLPDRSGNSAMDGSGNSPTSSLLLPACANSCFSLCFFPTLSIHFSNSFAPCASRPSGTKPEVDWYWFPRCCLVELTAVSGESTKQNNPRNTVTIERDMTPLLITGLVNASAYSAKENDLEGIPCSEKIVPNIYIYVRQFRSERKRRMSALVLSLQKADLRLNKNGRSWK